MYEASGHLTNFSDPLVDCRACKQRYRADKLLEDNNVGASESLSNDRLSELLKEHHIKCPNCGKED
jgi:glycyl-tRNA synthetase